MKTKWRSVKIATEGNGTEISKVKNIKKKKSNNKDKEDMTRRQDKVQMRTKRCL